MLVFVCIACRRSDEMEKKAGSIHIPVGGELICLIADYCNKMESVHRDSPLLPISMQAHASWPVALGGT